MIQFNNPKILYVLFALLIPILVHLFQLRKFQKTEFTNVKFLKEISLQTRKSSQIKKWLILLTRLSILTCIILAFSEPIIKNTENLNLEKEVIIYFDNSISTKEKGPKGELLKTSIKDFIYNTLDDKKVTVFTNNYVFKNRQLSAIKNDLINLNYTNYQLDYNIISLKAEQLFSNTKTLKNLIIVSDFQKNKEIDSFFFNEKIKTSLIQTLPVSNSNISIDTAYFVKKNIIDNELKVVINKQNSVLKNIPIAIYNNDTLISKSNVKLDAAKNVMLFDLPRKKQLNLKIVLVGTSNTSEKEFFITKNSDKKLNILAIGNKNLNNYLFKIYDKNEFNFKQQLPNEIVYSIFQKQNLIIFNELDNLSVPLKKNILKYTRDGGTLLIVPSENITIKNYNKLLNVFNNINENETRLTKINFTHPIYKNVFEKKVENFQYPFIKKYYPLKNYESRILSLENGNPLLVYASNMYAFSAALNSKNSNFKQSPLIVPTLYNIAKNTFKNNISYYTIGHKNNIDFDLKLKQDEVISLSKNNINFIPKQKIKDNVVSIETINNPKKPGIYNIYKKDKKTNLFVAYNYSNDESLREYHSLEKLKTNNLEIENSLTDKLTEINSEVQIGALWKWFIIFALLLLIVELLILKFFK